jgi:hypothetical protein
MFVHRILSGLRCRATQGATGRGVNIDQPADHVGWRSLGLIPGGYSRLVPDAFQRPGPEGVVPTADKRVATDATKRGTESRTIAAFSRPCPGVPGLSARICASFANMAHLQFR